MMLLAHANSRLPYEAMAAVGPTSPRVSPVRRKLTSSYVRETQIQPASGLCISVCYRVIKICEKSPIPSNAIMQNAPDQTGLWKKFLCFRFSSMLSSIVSLSLTSTLSGAKAMTVHQAACSNALSSQPR
jgi:hypothetical protein